MKHEAILIDSHTCTIRKVELNGLEDIQKSVGGWIEYAHTFPSGDVLFVNNEEGLLTDPPPTEFFAIRGGHQPFAGNGVVVPACDDEGETREKLGITPIQVAKLVTFKRAVYPAITQKETSHA